jgi:adenylate cyclase
MGREIERKFLVDPKLLPKGLPKGQNIVQGYLGVHPVVRVRTVSWGAGKEAYLTVKGEGRLSREEYEYEIPFADAQKMLKLCGFRKVEKVRRVLENGWELDEFKGRHKGLWLAELELKTVRSKLVAPPQWLGLEVTDDFVFANSMLAKTLDVGYERPYEQLEKESRQRQEYNKKIDRLRAEEKTPSSSNG